MIRSLKYWAGLMRLANGFTAISNILAAYLIIGLWKTWMDFPVYLIGATLCFYFAGMILNDFYDRNQDALERPERVIPRGLIHPFAAGAMGFYLLICGLIFAAYQGAPSFFVGILLCGAILLYDTVIKSGIAGSIMMGLCRYLNWLLGLSFIFASEPASSGILLGLKLGYLPELLKWILLIPVPVLFYVFSLTILSKEESRAERKWPIYITITGLLLGATSVLILFGEGIFSGWWGLAVMLPGLAYLIYRLWKLSHDFRPASVQSMIKLMVLGIIPLDAMLVLSASQSWLSLAGFFAVLILLWPARILSGRFAVT
ncbi:MAG: hypothetical protein CMN77_19850 [Spirochaetaceae bacterium]|nr:hypothetical protein [Spirochaetaceae bacterium]